MKKILLAAVAALGITAAPAMAAELGVGASIGGSSSSSQAASATSGGSASAIFGATQQSSGAAANSNGSAAQVVNGNDSAAGSNHSTTTIQSGQTSSFGLAGSANRTGAAAQGSSTAGNVVVSRYLFLNF